MGSKKDKESKVKKAIIGVATGVSPGLIAGDTKSAVIGGLVGIAAAGADALYEAVQDHRRRRLHALMEGLVLGAESPEEAGARVHAAMSDANVAPAVIEAAKAMDSVVDERVIPAIGALVRAHVMGAKPVDRFFRGALRLLSESTPEELARVAAFAGIVERFPGNDPEVMFMPRFSRDPSMPEYQVNEPERYGQAEFHRVPGGIEVPGVLAHHRLARAKSTDERGRATVVVRRSDARALRSCIEAAGISPVPSEPFS